MTVLLGIALMVVAACDLLTSCNMGLIGTVSFVGGVRMGGCK
jgi:hypothetical protein